MRMLQFHVKCVYSTYLSFLNETLNVQPRGANQPTHGVLYPLLVEGCGAFLGLWLGSASLPN